VYDKGTEYQGVFRNIVDKFGLFTKVIPNEASWQHGMTERHGGVLVDIIESVVKTSSVLMGTIPQNRIPTILRTCSWISTLAPTVKAHIPPEQKTA